MNNEARTKKTYAASRLQRHKDGEVLRMKTVAHQAQNEGLSLEMTSITNEILIKQSLLRLGAVANQGRYE